MQNFLNDRIDAAMNSDGGHVMPFSYKLFSYFYNDYLIKYDTCEEGFDLYFNGILTYSINYFDFDDDISDVDDKNILCEEIRSLMNLKFLPTWKFFLHFFYKHGISYLMARNYND